MTERNFNSAPTDLIVLLADDNPDDQFLMTRAFRSLPAMVKRVIMVENGQQVIDYLKGEGAFVDRALNPLPDVLLLDSHMPLLSGLEVLAIIRADPHFASLPVAVFSGLILPSLAESVQQFDAACATKPSELNELPEAVNGAICSALRILNRLSAPLEVAEEKCAVNGDPPPIDRKIGRNLSP